MFVLNVCATNGRMNGPVNMAHKIDKKQGKLTPTILINHNQTSNIYVNTHTHPYVYNHEHIPTLLGPVFFQNSDSFTI